MTDNELIRKLAQGLLKDKMQWKEVTAGGYGNEHTEQVAYWNNQIKCVSLDDWDLLGAIFSVVSEWPEDKQERFDSEFTLSLREWGDWDSAFPKIHELNPRLVAEAALEVWDD